MQKFITHNKKGYTLIELLTALFVSSSVLFLLVSTLGFSGNITAKITEKTSKNIEVKKTIIYLQKQILKSKVIVSKNGRIYLEDMENSAYYNYYNQSAGVVFRNKVAKATLEAVPGGKSQMAVGFDAFDLSLLEKGSLVLKYASPKEEYGIKVGFRYMGEVLYQ